MSRSVIVAAVVGLTVLAGCGDANEPSAPPTSEDALTTSSAAPDVSEETTEASPTSEAPEETETTDAPEMEQTEEGAEAFVEHYFEVLNEARTSGDTTALSDLSSGECLSCANFEESAQRGDLPPLQFEVASATLTGDAAVVPVDVSEEGTSGTAIFDLTWSGGWQVQSVKAEE